MEQKDDIFYIEKVKSGHTAYFSNIVENYQDIVFSIALKVLRNREDAEEMVNELEIDPLFSGYRGMKIDKQKLIDAIFRIAKISYCKNLSFEINPLIVNEEGAFAVDIKFE